MIKRNVSLLVPVFNESQSIECFIAEVNKLLQHEVINFDIVFIDDGSVDATVDIIKSTKTSIPTRILKLSRNFGKDHAICAGFEYCSSDAAIVMDVDLQDPLEVVLEMIPHWLSGYAIVNGKRTSRDGDSWLKRKTATMFYSLINRMTKFELKDNVGDFKLIDRQVIDVINLLPEKVRFFKGISAWVGFSQIDIPYSRPPRKYGETRWNYIKLWNFALDGIVGFTSAPLKIWTYIGFVVSSMSFTYGIFILVRSILFGVNIPGYSSIVVLLTFLLGIVLCGLGIVGEYVARIYEEVKGRPVYIIEDEIEVDNS